MIGLVSVGAHIPRYRLTGALLASVWGGGAGGERAVANCAEDSLTMACEATLNALGSRDVSRTGACFLASTSLPYVEKSNATLLASVADLGRDVVTADLGGSLRSGTTALRLALAAVKAGSRAEALRAAPGPWGVSPRTRLGAPLGRGPGAWLSGARRRGAPRLCA